MDHVYIRIYGAEVGRHAYSMGVYVRRCQEPIGTRKNINKSKKEFYL